MNSSKSSKTSKAKKLPSGKKAKEQKSNVKSKKAKKSKTGIENSQMTDTCVKSYKYIESISTSKVEESPVQSLVFSEISKMLFLKGVPNSKNFLWTSSFSNSPIEIIYIIKTIFVDNYKLVKDINLDCVFYDQLLDHFIQLVDIMPMKVKTPLFPHRIHLINVVITILINEWDSISLNIENGMLLFRRILKFTRYSDDSTAVEAFRLASKLHIGILGKGKKSDDDERILKMLELVHPNSNIYPLAIHLAKTTSQKGSTDLITCSHIAEAHFFDQNDISRIEELMLTNRPKKPLSTLQFLFAALIRRKELSNVIIKVISNVINRFKTSPGVKSFLINYVETAFKFIIMSFRLGKFKWRRSILLNLMDSISKQKVKYLREEIAAHTAAIVIASNISILEGKLSAFAAPSKQMSSESRLVSVYKSLPEGTHRLVKTMMWHLPSMDDPALKKRFLMKPRPPFPKSFAMVYPKSTRVDFPYYPRAK